MDLVEKQLQPKKSKKSEEYSCIQKRDSLINAANSDSVSNVKKLIEQGIPITAESIVVALVQGNFKVAEYLLENAEKPVIKEILEIARETQAYPLITFMLTKNLIGKEEIIDIALHDLSLFETLKIKPDEALIDLAVSDSAPDVLDYILEYNENLVYYAMRSAIKHDNFDLLERLVVNNKRLPRDLLFIAITNNKQEIYEYLLQFYADEIKEEVSDIAKRKFS